MNHNKNFEQSYTFWDLPLFGYKEKLLNNIRNTLDNKNLSDTEKLKIISSKF